MGSKILELGEDAAEVVADDGELGVDPVAEAFVRVVAAEMSIGFEVADEGLNVGAASEFLCGLAVDVVPLLGTVDPKAIGTLWPCWPWSP